MWRVSWQAIGALQIAHANCGWKQHYPNQLKQAWWSKMEVINCPQTPDWGTPSFGSYNILIWIPWSLLCTDKKWLHFKKPRPWACWGCYLLYQIRQFCCCLLSFPSSPQNLFYLSQFVVSYHMFYIVSSLEQFYYYICIIHTTLVVWFGASSCYQNTNK